VLGGALLEEEKFGLRGNGEVTEKLKQFTRSRGGRGREALKKVGGGNRKNKKTSSKRGGILGRGRKNLSGVIASRKGSERPLQPEEGMSKRVQSPECQSERLAYYQEGESDFQERGEKRIFLPGEKKFPSWE